MGTFISSTQFGTIGFQGSLNASSGKAFIAKYDNSLTFQWAIAIGENALAFGAEIKDIVVDASGNVIVTGQFQSITTVDFNLGQGSSPGPGADPGPYTPITASSNGSIDMFVAKYNSGGLCQWVKTAGGTSGDEGLGVDYDNAGNVYVTGAFIGQNISFGSVTLSEVGGGSSGDLFVAKYSTAGTLVNAFNIGNALAEKSNGIAVQKSTGDFVITGYFLKDGIPIDFDPSAGGTANEAGVTMKDMFVAKYSSALAYQWHKAVGSSLDDVGNNVKLSANNVIVTGGFSGTSTNFGNSNSLTSSGGLDAFIAMYTFSSGTCLSASSMGGSSNEEGLALAYGGSKIYLAGYNQGSGDYDPGAGITTLTNAGGKDIFFARYTDASCTMPTISADPVSASRCAGTSVTFSVTATGPGPFTYIWKKGGVDIVTATSSSYTISSPVTGDASNYTVAVTNSCGTIISAAATLTVSTMVTSNAGSAQSVCNSATATLAGNNPSPGTGVWSTTAGSGSASSTNSATSGVTGLTVGGNSTFQWTITNGSCVSSSTVVITSSSPVTSNAGSAQSICNSTTTSLSSTAPSLGTGTWSTLSGTGSATSVNSPSSAVTGLTIGASTTFQWTVSNGACSANSSVTITVSSPVTSNAGSAQSVCNSATATLAANNPSPGTGSWSTTAGSGSASSSNSATSAVTGLTVGASSTFQWTITNGACVSSSTVVITSSSPVTSNAGSAQSICNVTTTTLAGNNPAPGTGVWTKTSGAGSISSPAASNSGVTGLTVGASSTFQWTVTNGACSANSSIIITVSAPVTSNAGPAQSLCNVTTTTLAATVPSLGTGTWSTLSGTGSATSVNSASSGVTGLTIGASTTFLWTVTNGTCTSNSSVVVNVSAAGSANAGTNQILCNATTTNLAGAGTGTWSLISGTGSITTPSSNTSGITGLTIGAVSVFQWTVTNGACSGTDQVSVTVSSPVTANAGVDQTVCNATSTTLAATVPSVGSGTWSKISGTGTVSTPSSATSSVTGLTVGSSSTFQWIVTNGACVSSPSNVSITSSFPVSANAGSNQSLCNATSANLSAVSPGVGTGLWTVTSGTGTFAFNNIANSSVSGLTVGAASVFKWTVTNGACSANASVTITSSAVVTADSGVDQALCNVTTGTLAATNPTVGSGTWTLTSGTGSITSPSSFNSAISGLTLNASSTFLWTVTNGACSASASVIVSVVTPASITTDPLSKAMCTGSPVSFSGVVSGTGTYKWKKGAAYVVNGGTVSGATTTTLTISSLVAGDANDYRLEVTNSCGVITSNPATLTVSSSVLTINTQPVIKAACTGGTVVFDVVASGTGTLTYQWKKAGANMSDVGNISGSTTPSVSIASITSGDANNYSVSITNACGTISSDVVTLTVNAAAIITQPVTQTVCPGTDVSFSVVATGVNVTYQWQKNASDILLATGSSYSITGASVSDQATYLCKVSSCSNTISTNTADLILDICTGTYDAMAGRSVVLYPNPTRSELHVSLNGNDRIESITIFNSTGDVVYSAKNVQASTYDLSVSHLAQGLYYVAIESKGSRTIEKLEILN